MTCRHCLLACTLCNIPSTASHFLSAFCLFSLDRLPRLCFCSFFFLFQRFSLCWIFPLCSEELYYTEMEPNADKLQCLNQTGNPPIQMLPSGSHSLDLVPGTGLFCILGGPEQFVPSFSNPQQPQQGEVVSVV